MFGTECDVYCVRACVAAIWEKPSLANWVQGAAVPSDANLRRNKGVTVKSGQHTTDRLETRQDAEEAVGDLCNLQPSRFFSHSGNKALSHVGRTPFHSNLAQALAGRPTG